MFFKDLTVGWDVTRSQWAWSIKLYKMSGIGCSPCSSMNPRKTSFFLVIYTKKEKEIPFLQRLSNIFNNLPSFLLFLSLGALELDPKYPLK